MGKKNVWQIRKIDQETVNKIKQEAELAGMSIGEWFDYLYSDYQPPKKVGVRKIKMDNNVLPELQKRARERNISLKDYLNHLMEVDKNYEERIKRLKEALEG